MNAPKPLRSLKSKALQLLAQREQSRLELRRKLMAHARAEEAAQAAAARSASASFATSAGSAGLTTPARLAGLATPAAGSAVTPFSHHDALQPEPCGSCVGAAVPAAERVDEVLSWLDAHKFQSDERFVESRVNARSGRYGDLRIQQELKQHGVALDADAARALGETEGPRAWAVRERRFGTPPVTASDAARQSRFLTARGFSPDAVRQVMRRARSAPMGAEAPSEDH